MGNRPDPIPERPRYHRPVRVAQLWRYPVKSMGGEQLEQAEVDERGLVGDRRWGILDQVTGKVLTGRREPRLLFARSRLMADGTCQITLDDGEVIGDDEDLCRWLGHAVSLIRAQPDGHGSYEIAVDFENEDASPWVGWDGPDGSFHDSGRTQLSLLSLGRTRQWDPRRFRANILLDGGNEEDLIDADIRLGTTEATVVKAIDRCVMTTRPQPDGIERDLDVLRTINGEHGGNLGVGALVTHPGTVAVGDEVVRLD